MKLRRGLVAISCAVLVASAASVLPGAPDAAVHNLPARQTSADLWSLSSAFSEEGGTFHSDNFVSNEGRFQTVLPELVRRVRRSGLYVGVGPEQNFTYIAAVRPAMAFIVDIRRGNLHEHLLYKALFEMSNDRAEFLARLFSRPKPAGIGASSSPEALFAAFEPLDSSEALYQANLQAVTDRLTRHHRFPLSADDLAGIDYVYRTAFFADGPDLNYRLTGQGGFGRGGTPSYAQLMTADDGEGTQRSYLATEANFAIVKAMQEKNLIVPVVGDFGGTKALRSVARYARERAATVSAFYLSNVEQYLRPAGTWSAFCANVAAMPLDETSTFVRSVRGGRSQRTGFDAGFILFTPSLGAMRTETDGCGTSSVSVPPEARP